MSPLRRLVGLVALAVLASAGCARRPLTLPWLHPESGVLWAETFDGRLPRWWREVIVRHRTQYAVVDRDGRRCLRADSHGGASMLVAHVQYDPDKFEWLTWEWRVDRFAGDAADLQDLPARVSVFFDTTGLPWDQRRLDYVWSPMGGAEQLLADPESRQVRTIVADGGQDQLGRWRRVSRNLEDDYERAFEEHPVRVVAIGFMSDADDSRAEAVAYLDNLVVSRRALPPDDAQPQVNSSHGR
jgi:hypothetical protein